MSDWFMYFQVSTAIAFIFALPFMIEGKRIINLLKERFLSKKGFVKAEFIGFNRRRLVRIVKPDDNGMFVSKEAANFINKEDSSFEVKDAKFNLNEGRTKIVEGVMPVYTFVAGSAFPHEYFSDSELQRVGTSKQVSQALLAAEASGEIEFLKKLFANPKVLLVLFGILGGIVLSIYFTYETYTTLQTLLVSKGGVVV